MAAGKSQTLFAADAASADHQVELISGAAKTELEKLEVIMDAGLVVIQVLIIDHGVLHQRLRRDKPIGLGEKGIGSTLPGNVMTEKESGDANPLQFFISGILVADEMLCLNPFQADQVGNTQAQKATELFQPAAVEDIVLTGGSGTAVLILRVFTPDDQRNVELDGGADRDGENSNVFRPGNITNLSQADTVQLAPDNGVTSRCSRRPGS